MAGWRRGLMMAMALAGAPLRAADAPLQPSSAWVLDYADERCSLIRGFGPGGEDAVLRIDSFGSWREFRFLVSGKRVPTMVSPASEISYRLTPDTADREAMGLHGTAGTVSATSFSGTFAPIDAPIKRGTPVDKARAIAAVVKPPTPDFERQVDTLTIKVGARSLSLAIGEMGKPLEAMRACVDDLHKSWGLDPAVQKALASRPIIQTATIRDVQRRFPPKMIGKTAYVPIRIMVNRLGKVTGCVDQANAAPDEFMQAACAGLEAGTYTPARDSAW